MLTGVAFCPHPPALIPAVAQRAAPELDAVRAACRTAIRRIAPPGRRIAVIGAGSEWARYESSARGSLAGFGVPLELGLGSDDDAGRIELPLSLTVGAWLLRDALGPDCGAVGYSVGPGVGDLPGSLHRVDTALLVMGDGSACRSLAAPGYLDERAAPFDSWTAQALRTGEGDLLHHPGYYDGRYKQLRATGAPVWDEVAWHLEPYAWDAELLYDGAPYGVGYHVAAWTAASTSRSVRG